MMNKRFFNVGIFGLLVNVPFAIAMNVKPGLWKVEVVLEENGEATNVTEELQKPSAAIPPEQRKELRDALKTSGNSQSANFGDGARVCLSPEMLRQGEGLLPTKAGEGCATTILKKTDREVTSTFQCKDGSRGDMRWKMKNEKAYSGRVNFVRADGQKSKVDYTGKFIAVDCGTMKPRQ